MTSLVRRATLRLVLIASAGLVTTSCSEDESYEHDFVVSDAQWALAIQQADTAALRDSANRIQAWHAEVQTGIQLRPAITKQTYLELTNEIPCSLPQELEALWKWRNGETTDYFVWYHGFLSLQEAIEQYNYLLSEPLFGWRENWIPVFQFQDEWYFVECKEESTAGAPMIHYFTESGPSYAYTNMTTYLRTMAEAMDSRTLNWENGWWSDSIRMRDLAAVHGEYNDLAKFPYAVE